MKPLILECASPQTPESLVEQLQGEPGVVLLRSSLIDPIRGRFSFVTARPFLQLETRGAETRLRTARGIDRQFGSPWPILDRLMSRYEILDQVDLPFPLGGCFGFWGYELKNSIESRLPPRALSGLELPDCQAGFCASLVAFDHYLAKTWIISTGLTPDGSRDSAQAHRDVEFWRDRLEKIPSGEPGTVNRRPASGPPAAIRSTFSRGEFIAAVEKAQRYIRAGDIYQVNLAQCFSVHHAAFSGWELYRALLEVSPAPFAAYIEGPSFQIASASPELFLRMSGARVVTRPIKGTRPRGSEAAEDTRLAFELQTSPKELAELIMITDLLRNDLGKVCEFGSVQTPELAHLERYAQVQHLVSTVEGRLRPEVSHLAALASAFPGGSISGAPKIRALEIIDELEPITRGPYTGALGYLGFNREGQLSIPIRTAICHQGAAYFHSGAGVVADSVAEAEYEETLVKAAGFFEAVQRAECGCGHLLAHAADQAGG